MSLTEFVVLTVVCWIVAGTLIVLALRKPHSEPGRGRRRGRRPHRPRSIRVREGAKGSFSGIQGIDP